MRFPLLEIALGLVVLVVFVVLQWKLKRRGRSNMVKLPPGSMGLPFIGETVQFFLPSKSRDMPPFIKKRVKKYGTLFKTSLIGRPVVVLADPEFNEFVLLQERKSVETWYLDSFSKLVGHDTPDLEVKTNVTGYIHKHLRNLILNHMGSESLKGKLLREIQAMTEKALDAWSVREFVDVRHDPAGMIFEFIWKQLLGYDAEKSWRSASEDFHILMDGLMSFPMNIPGTAFHKSLKSKEKLLNVMRGKIAERMAAPAEASAGDFLDHIIGHMRTQSFLSAEFVAYILMGLLLASFEAIPGTIVMILILLTENPQVLQELIKENKAALHNRMILGAEGVTWEEYKSMPYTLHVVNESLRLASNLPGVMRRAIKDIEWNGYLIPEGWTILISQAALHLNPEVYEDPVAFNPSRWELLDRTNVVGRYYVPFGGGGRQCAGAEFVRASCAVFLQALMTKYRWTKLRGGKIIRTPFLKIKGGFDIKVSKIQE